MLATFTMFRHQLAGSWLERFYELEIFIYCHGFLSVPNDFRRKLSDERRERDSNPRGVAPYGISSAAH